MRISGESPGYEVAPLQTGPSASGHVSLADGRAAGAAAFLKALKGLGRAVEGGEALVASASRGSLGGLDSGQLIALQAGIYRYSEAVDLVGKLVDRASNAVKTVISPH